MSEIFVSLGAHHHLVVVVVHVSVNTPQRFKGSPILRCDMSKGRLAAISAALILLVIVSSVGIWYVAVREKEDKMIESLANLLSLRPN